MHWHAINENRNESDKVLGSILWAGRGWLHFNAEGGFQSKSINGEWYFGKHARHNTLEIKTSFVFERELTFSIGIFGLFCFFLTFAFPFFPNWSYKHGDRQVGIRVFDSSIWLDLWVNDTEWHKSDPFWKKHIVITPADILFGRRKHTQKDLSEHYAEIPMPEANYPAKIKLFESTWKRPRWPFSEKMIRADIDMFTPIPFPGKGENSWDCGEDATHSMTGPYSTVEDAIEAMRKSVMRDRERYGGQDWQPSTD